MCRHPSLKRQSFLVIHAGYGTPPRKITARGVQHTDTAPWTLRNVSHIMLIVLCQHSAPTTTPSQTSTPALSSMMVKLSSVPSIFTSTKCACTVTTRMLLKRSTPPLMQKLQRILHLTLKQNSPHPYWPDGSKLECQSWKRH